MYAYPPRARSGIRQHTSAYASIRQHTSAYVSIRQHTSAYVSIRQHTSAYVSIRQQTACECPPKRKSAQVLFQRQARSARLCQYSYFCTSESKASKPSTPVAETGQERASVAGESRARYRALQVHKPFCLLVHLAHAEADLVDEAVSYSYMRP